METSRPSSSPQPFVEEILSEPGTSIVVTRKLVEKFPFSWHKHAAFELTLIELSSGTRLVGDDVSPYHSGELTLLGPMLPHTWVSHETDEENQATMVHFEQPAVAVWPEAEVLEPLLSAASRGLAFGGPGLESVTEAVRDLPHRLPLLKLTSLMEVLVGLATRSDITTSTLSSSDVQTTHEPIDPQMARALQYVAEGYSGEISQEYIANLVGLDPATFSRRFRRTAGRTFTRHVQETRVAEAARRLSDSADSITMVAFESGFGNLASFNRVFLRLKGQTPSEYRGLRRGQAI